MIKNYITVALRNLSRHKVFSFINILGLAIGLACCITIFLFVRDELRYDTFHTKADRIYRVVNSRVRESGEDHIALTPPAFGPTLQRDFPEVQQMVRFFDMRAPLITYEDKKFFETDFLLADSTVLDVFTLPLLKGNPQTALKERYSLIITESVAKKYFGEQDPMGKVLTVDGEMKFTVTGVMQDLPVHSHLKINVLGNFNMLKDFIQQSRLENWVWHQFYTYILLQENYNVAQLEAKLPSFVKTHASEVTARMNTKYTIGLQALTDVHLRSSHLEHDIAQKGDIQYVYAFSVIALFALLIACFNFMNLSTARSAQRAKEVGLRKVVGAGRRQLIAQFIGESILLVSIAMVMAFILVYLTLPIFNNFSGKQLQLFSAIDILTVLGVLAIILLVGLVAGSYPAFFLSAFQPVKVLKGELRAKHGGYSLRQTLVVLQFAISTVLIIGTTIVFRQLNYIQNTNLGFSKEQLVSLPIRNGEMRRNYEGIKNELLQNTAIKSATACYGLPGDIFAGDGILIPGRDTDYSINMFLVDHTYIPTLEMEMVAGRNFSKEYGTDAENAFILNETAVKDLGWNTPEEALNKEIHWKKWNVDSAGISDSLKRGKVIGVVKDFHYKSLHQKIEPLILHIYQDAYTSIVVKVRPENMQATLNFLEKKWTSLDAEWPFEYTFLDEQFAKKYESERVFGKVFTAFTLLSIFIACLGLFGLASFTASQRSREIGIRKVLGASVAGIVFLLSKDFLKLVLLALLIAIPLAWYAMSGWLEDFAYRIDMDWWMFALAGLVALLIALFTVSFQSIKAALANPVKSLRNE